MNFVQIAIIMTGGKGGVGKRREGEVFVWVECAGTTREMMCV